MRNWKSGYWNSKRTESHEQTKIVLSNSWKPALRQCLVHIVPILTSVLILFLNLHGFYIGSDFNGPIRSETINLLLLQVAAKVHELLIVASLGFVILQMVRHELLFGDGLPLGLVGSGLAFSNFGFFFKREFYGGLKYLTEHGHMLRKIAFLLTLIVSGFTAALAGPASAVLLVPKSQAWNSGGTDLFLNGTSEDFWPADTAHGLPELQRLCSTSNSTSLGICPAGGFFSLWEHWGRVNASNYDVQDVRPYAKNLSGSSFYWPVNSPTSEIPPLYALGGARNGDDYWLNTFLVQPHAAVAAMLQLTAADWWQSLLMQRHLSASLVDDRVIQSTSQAAITSVRCGKPQNMSSSQQTVQFPSIQGRFDYKPSLPLNLSTLNNGAVDHLRFQWISLPDKYGPASIGALFESAWTPDQSRTVIGCTVQSGWIPATFFTDEYSFWSGWYPWNLQFGERLPALAPLSPGQSLPATSGRIAFSESWLNLLTPPVPSNVFAQDGWQPSTIESILENVGLSTMLHGASSETITESWSVTNAEGRDATSFLESIIASVVVDGLSRSGSHRLFNTSTGTSRDWSLATYQPLPDFRDLIFRNATAVAVPEMPESSTTRLHATMQISGFAFQKSLATYLSASVLLTHMVMAVIHIAWLTIHRHSSQSFSSVAELIALAQNSRPALKALKNTGAGIKCSNTFAKIARVRVRPSHQTGEPERVELIFENGEVADALYPHSRRASRADNEDDETSSDTINRAHPAATWPLESNRLSLRPDNKGNSRSSSMERLVTRKVLFDEEKMNTIRINGWYG